MEAQLSILFLLLSTFIIDLDASDERIVGGYDARQPAVASLRNDEFRHICGGTIVSIRKLVTSAQCCTPTLKYVTIGSNSLSSNYRKYNILRCIIRDDYKPGFGGKDIAVVITSNDMVLDNNARIMQLPRSVSDCPIRPYHLTGWGSKTPNGPPSDLLQQIVTLAYSTDECRRFLPFIESDEICIYTGAGGACYGDAGAPVHFGFLCGVMSRALGCAMGFHDVVTYVLPHVNWIRSL